MFGKADTSTIVGIDGKKVTVEADFGDGLPSFEMVGFLGSEVREAKERVRSALRNTGIAVPPGKLTVSLSPADLRKQGNGFDLPIAVSILAALGIVPAELLSDLSLIGELSLDGKLRKVNGILSHVMLARETGKKAIIVPKENGREAAVFRDFKAYPASSLEEVISIVVNRENAFFEPFSEPESENRRGTLDFSDVFGQESVKRASVVAASGMHGFLMIGPPGTGKTLMARRIPSILPPLSESERIECTKIASVAGLLSPTEGLVSERPFRSPHHTVSSNGLVGGGTNPRPGEMSLAHNGVLFLDELAEFRKSTLEVMRQPLEDRKVVISRVNGSYTFPTSVMLVAAMNPCRCGYYPDRNRCKCTDAEVRAYLSKLSKPLLDRIDLIAEVPRVPIEKIGKTDGSVSSDDMRALVMKALERQKARFRGDTIRFNSELTGRGIARHCALDEPCRELLKDAFDRFSLSVRARDRILKVARTIADIEGAENIGEIHLSEAISYRSMNRKFWGEL